MDLIFFGYDGLCQVDLPINVQFRITIKQPSFGFSIVKLVTLVQDLGVVRQRCKTMCKPGRDQGAVFCFLSEISILKCLPNVALFFRMSTTTSSILPFKVRTSLVCS